MQRNRFHQVVATSIVAVAVAFGAFGYGASPNQSAPNAAAATRRAPSGNYATRMPDGTTIRLSFRAGGAVTIAMTEAGETNTFDGKWVLNGEVILVEGGEGLTMQLSWRGDELVTDFGGATLTFTRA
jgi:hypothetical protein